MLHHVFNLDQMHILHGGAFSTPAHIQLYRLLRTVADQVSGWHWGQALGEPASCLGWKLLLKGSSLPPLLATPASPIPALLSAIT